MHLKPLLFSLQTVNDDIVHTWTGGVLKERRRYQVISADHGKPFAKSELNMGMPVQCVVQVGRYNLIGTAVSSLGASNQYIYIL